MPGGICWKTYLKLHLKDPELHSGILTLTPFRRPSEVRQRTEGVFCLESAFACSLISLGPSCAPVPSSWVPMVSPLKGQSGPG